MPHLSSTRGRDVIKARAISSTRASPRRGESANGRLWLLSSPQLDRKDEHKGDDEIADRCNKWREQSDNDQHDIECETWREPSGQQLDLLVTRIRMYEVGAQRLQPQERQQQHRPKKGDAVNGGRHLLVVTRSQVLGEQFGGERQE